MTNSGIRAESATTTTSHLFQMLKARALGAQLQIKVDIRVMTYEELVVAVHEEEKVKQEKKDFLDESK